MGLKEEKINCELCNKKFEKKRKNNSKNNFCTTECLFLYNLIKKGFKRKVEKYTKGEIQEIIIKTDSNKYKVILNDNKK